MSIMDRREKPYHTAAGEADRLRTIIALYADDPECIKRAQAALDKHLDEHVPRSSASKGTRP
jgi:hypothetical protein